MNTTLRILIFLSGLFLFLIIFRLLRRKRLREELSVLWLLVSVSLTLGSVADLVVDPLAFALGINYPPALIFLIFFFIVVLTMFYFSVVVSDLKSKNKELSQKVALMEYRIRELLSARDNSHSKPGDSKDTKG
jgi:heme A synthase